jgi:hypothetical protein
MKPKRKKQWAKRPALSPFQIHNPTFKISLLCHLTPSLLIL